MIELDFDTLRKTAEAAATSSPGNWYAAPVVYYGEPQSEDNWFVAADGGNLTGTDTHQIDATYMAMFDPTTALALLDLVESLKRENAALQRDVEQLEARPDGDIPTCGADSLQDLRAKYLDDDSFFRAMALMVNQDVAEADERSARLRERVDQLLEQCVNLEGEAVQAKRALDSRNVYIAAYRKAAKEEVVRLNGVLTAMTPKPIPDTCDLRKVLEAATPLPWRRDTFSMSKERAGSAGFAKNLWGVSSYDDQGRANFHFIATAIEAFPGFLDAAEASKAEMGKARLTALKDAIKVVAKMEAPCFRSSWNATNYSIDEAYDAGQTDFSLEVERRIRELIDAE